MILQFMNDSSSNSSSSISKEELDSLFFTQDSNFKSLVKEVVTNPHGRVQDNLRSLKFEVS